jgi:23S rRNA-/tRNA-specific pseudouridylate synthase
MHQLRVHCAAIGRPIAGDGKYGGLFALGRWAAPRLMLHAWRLVAPHPDDGRPLTITAPIPAVFLDACAALQLDLGALLA